MRTAAARSCSIFGNPIGPGIAQNKNPQIQAGAAPLGPGAREAAKQDQLRARHRLSKFLLRHGRRPPSGIKPWTLNYLDWDRQQVQFEQPAQDYTRLDYLHEVEHSNDRVQRLEVAITEAVKLAVPRCRKCLRRKGSKRETNQPH